MICIKCEHKIKMPESTNMVIMAEEHNKFRTEGITSVICSQCSAEHHTRWIIETTWVVDDLYEKEDDIHE